MLGRSPETNVLVFIKRDRKRRGGQFSEAPGRNEVVWMLQTSVQDTSRLSRPRDTMATLMCGSLHLVAYGAPRTHLSKPFRRDGESCRDKGQIQSRCPKLNGCLQVRENIPVTCEGHRSLRAEQTFLYRRERNISFKGVGITAVQVTPHISIQTTPDVIHRKSERLYP